MTTPVQTCAGCTTPLAATREQAEAEGWQFVPAQIPARVACRAGCFHTFTIETAYCGDCATARPLLGGPVEEGSVNR